MSKQKAIDWVEEIYSTLAAQAETIAQLTNRIEELENANTNTEYREQSRSLGIQNCERKQEIPSQLIGYDDRIPTDEDLHEQGLCTRGLPPDFSTDSQLETIAPEECTVNARKQQLVQRKQQLVQRQQQSEERSRLDQERIAEGTKELLELIDSVQDGIREVCEAYTGSVDLNRKLFEAYTESNQRCQRIVDIADQALEHSGRVTEHAGRVTEHAAAIELESRGSTIPCLAIEPTTIDIIPIPIISEITGGIRNTKPNGRVKPKGFGKKK